MTYYFYSYYLLCKLFKLNPFDRTNSFKWTAIIILSLFQLLNLVSIITFIELLFENFHLSLSKIFIAIIYFTIVFLNYILLIKNPRYNSIEKQFDEGKTVKINFVANMVTVYFILSILFYTLVANQNRKEIKNNKEEMQRLLNLPKPDK